MASAGRVVVAVVVAVAAAPVAQPLLVAAGRSRSSISITYPKVAVRRPMKVASARPRSHADASDTARDVDTARLEAPRFDAPSVSWSGAVTQAEPKPAPDRSE